LWNAHNGRNEELESEVQRLQGELLRARDPKQQSKEITTQQQRIQELQAIVAARNACHICMHIRSSCEVPVLEEHPPPVLEEQPAKRQKTTPPVCTVPGWGVHWSEEYTEWYFYHEGSRTSSWAPPE